MNIEAYTHPELSVVQQVRELERVCQARDGLKGSLFLDPTMNFSAEAPCLLVAYEEGQLIGAMTFLCPSLEEAELSSRIINEENKAEVVHRNLDLGKALAGGYFPIGSASCTQEVYDVIYNKSAAFVVGYSWVGNPLGASVVSKTLDILKDENLVAECAKKGDYLQKKLKELDHPTIGEVRGLGTMIGVELVKDKTTKEPFPRALGYAFKVAEETLEQGMFLEGCAVLPS